MPQRGTGKTGEKTPAPFDPRNVAWTHTRSDEAWRKMMQGGRSLTPSVNLPFPAQQTRTDSERGKL